MQHTTAPPPQLVLPNSPTPLALASIMGKLLAKSPEDRFQTPRELIDALLALRPGQPSLILDDIPPVVDEWQSQFDLLVTRDASASGRSPAPELTVRSRSRSGWMVAAAVALLVVPVAVYALTRKASTEEPAAPGPAHTEEEPADELKVLRKAMASGENRDELRNRILEFRAKRTGTPAAMGAAGLLRRLPSPLDRLSPVKDPSADQPVVRLKSRGAAPAWLRFSATDDRLMVGRPGQSPEEWELPLLSSTGRMQGLNISEDGIPAATPDGRTIVIVDPTGKLLVCSEGKTRTVELGQPVRLAAVGPDGKSAVVALTNADERLTRISLDSGKVLSRLDHPSDGVTSLAISHDGASCLAIGPENLIRVLSLSTGKLSQAYDGPGLTTPCGVFGPDGHRLYLIGAFRAPGRISPGRANPEVSYEVGMERANPFTSRIRPDQPATIAVSADESAVAVGTRSGKLYVYTAASGKPIQEIHFAQCVRALALSTHGRVLAVGLEDGSILLVPLKA
jgi:hypothetical protein